NANVTLTNCTLTNNAAEVAPGGVMAVSSTLTAVNSILWGNSPGDVGQFDSSVAITFSDVAGGFEGVGNIDANPLFVNAAGPDGIVGTPDDDLRLGAGSPCLDAGSNDANLPEVDGFGAPRIQQCRVDMGAAESLLFADCDVNGLGDACEI